MAPVPLTTLRIIWGSMLVSVGGLATIAFVMPADEASRNPALVLPLSVVAVAEVIASFTVPQIQSRRALENTKLEVVEETDPDAEVLFRDQAPRRRVFADPASAREAALRIFTPASILRCALAFSPALLGLIVHMTGNRLEAAVALMALAVVALAAHYPSAAKLLEPLERHFGAKLVERGALRRAA